MSNDLGASAALNEFWDFDIDRTGDIKASSGIEELKKDVAFVVGQEVSGEIGNRLDERTSKRIEVGVRDVLLEDVRINSINSLSVQRVGRTNRFRVDGIVNTDEGPFDLVFEVEL